MLLSLDYAAGPATSSGTQTAWTRLLCHFGTRYTLVLRLFFSLSHAKSNYSRTSTKCDRKSNHSRTYAKTGGGGGGYMLTSPLSEIVGAPTFLSLAPPLSFFRILLNSRLTTNNSKLTNAKPAIGFRADERPGPNSKRVARQIRRHCQATAAPCPCVRGIQGE